MSVPSWVVALRHSATHVTMPSLTLLKSAAEFALKWLKENYWEKQEALLSISKLIYTAKVLLLKLIAVISDNGFAY